MTAFGALPVSMSGLTIGQADTLYVLKAGDTMTGSLTINVPAGALFDVISNAGANIRTQRYSNDVNAGQYIVRKARGTFAAPAVIVQNDLCFNFLGQAYDGAAFVTAVTMNGRVTAATPSATDMESELRGLACPAASVTQVEVYSFSHRNGLQLFANIVIDANRVYRNRIFTFGTLPAGVAGMETNINDALAPAWNVALAGGGAVFCGARYNGAAWTAF